MSLSQGQRLCSAKLMCPCSNGQHPDVFHPYPWQLSRWWLHFFQLRQRLGIVHVISLLGNADMWRSLVCEVSVFSWETFCVSVFVSKSRLLEEKWRDVMTRR